MDHHYTVTGIWPFPVDMLRYDRAKAATPADQDLIDRYSQDTCPDTKGFEQFTVRLIGEARPTPNRWGSFGWVVEGGTGLDTVTPVELLALLQHLYRSRKTVIRDPHLKHTLTRIIWSDLVSDVYEMPGGGYTAMLTQAGEAMYVKLMREVPAEERKADAADATALFADHLKKLSDKASKGPWEHKIIRTPYDDDDTFPEKTFVSAPRNDPSHPYDIEVMGEDRHERLYPPKQAYADGELIVELVNAYRDGRLIVAVDPAKGKDYSVEHSLEALGDGGFGALVMSRLLRDD